MTSWQTAGIGPAPFPSVDHQGSSEMVPRLAVLRFLRAQRVG